MPTTRRQQAIQEGRLSPERAPNKPAPRATQKRKLTGSTAKKSNKRKEGSGDEQDHMKEEKPPSKRARVAGDDTEQKRTPISQHTEQEARRSIYTPGTIERGHIYFFYRPKVEVEDVHSIDEVKNLHMLLIPRPPRFAVADAEEALAPKADPTRTEEAEMNVLTPGADAVPAPVTRNTSKQFHRLVTIGKKKLPDPHGKGRKETFWGSVTSVGEDLRNLVEGLGPKTYETKMRGTRHEGPARLVARGGYALVNTEAGTPSQRETHLGYNVSHPAPSDIGDVQAAFGIYSASSFIVQVKNPDAPNTNPAMGHTKEPEYPEWIMKEVFGNRGREPYRLRFASIETPEMLDHVGAQLLLIAARDGQQGLETSLGEGRGEALAREEDKEAHHAIMDVFKEIGLDPRVFTKDTMKGHWV